MEEKLKVLRIIHLALCGGVALAYLFLGNFTSFEFFEILRNDINASIYLVIPIAAIILSNFLFKTNLKTINKKLTISENFGTYQTAFISKMAILEMGCFLILFLKPEFVLIGLFLIIYMVSLWPSENSIKSDIDRFTS